MIDRAPLGVIWLIVAYKRLLKKHPTKTFGELSDEEITSELEAMLKESDNNTLSIIKQHNMAMLERCYYC